MPEKCACRIKPSKGQGFRLGNYGVVTAREVDVLMCPLHAAAEDMALALEATVRSANEAIGWLVAEAKPDDLNMAMRADLRKSMRTACAALAKAGRAP